MDEYDKSYTNSIIPDTSYPGIALLWRAVNPSKTVLHLFNASPTALLTRDFGVGSFRPVSSAFGLRGFTDSKRDLYLISKCEVWVDDSIAFTICQQFFTKCFLLLFGFKKKNLLFLFHLEKKGLFSPLCGEHNGLIKSPRVLSGAFRSFLCPSRSDGK